MKIVTISLCLMLVISYSYAQADKSKAQTYQELDWVALIPQADLDVLNNPPSEIDQIPDGSSQDRLMPPDPTLLPSPNQLISPAEQRYQQALSSTQVREEYNGKRIKIPGFIVPLEVSDDQLVTEFFLVPYFGACIHMPPPPPNQIIHIHYPKGLPLDSLVDPFWVKGILFIELSMNELGTSAYAMAMDDITLYDE